MSTQTLSIATKIVEEITTYNSSEFIEEAKDVVDHRNEIITAASAPPGDTVTQLASEIEKANPNMLKIVLMGLALLISLVGTFFGVWFGVPK